VTDELVGRLEQWRAQQDSARRDPAATRELLAQLQGWKSDHDAERARQSPPFMQMMWDAVFGEEDEQVAHAIAQIEAELARA
jgi:hypothetical protein